MTIRFVAALALAVLFLFASAAAAKAADFTVFVGGVKPGKLTISNVRTSLDSSAVYGFRLSTNFVPLFGMEHTLAFSSDFLFPHTETQFQSAKGFVYSSNLIVN